MCGLHVASIERHVSMKIDMQCFSGGPSIFVSEGLIHRERGRAAPHHDLGPYLW